MASYKYQQTRDDVKRSDVDRADDPFPSSATKQSIITFLIATNEI